MPLFAPGQVLAFSSFMVSRILTPLLFLCRAGKFPCFPCGWRRLKGSVKNTRFRSHSIILQYLIFCHKTRSLQQLAPPVPKEMGPSRGKWVKLPAKPEEKHQQQLLGGLNTRCHILKWYNSLVIKLEVFDFMKVCVFLWNSLHNHTAAFVVVDWVNGNLFFSGYKDCWFLVCVLLHFLSD